MLKGILACVTILACYNGYGQVKIGGAVQYQGVGVVHAIVTVLDEGGEILAYAESKSDGSFLLTIDPPGKPAFLEVSHISYRNLRLGLKGTTQEGILAELLLRDVSLPEVKVKTASPAIRQNRDTISYRADEFRNSNDRVLKDVLTKLPGITVNPNGQVLYQNRAINRFYIDGIDVLDDRYNIATNNLSVDAVDKIQILENHQPIRVLDSLVYSDQSALNIKLKPGRSSRPIGRADAQAGYGDGWQGDKQLAIFGLGSGVKKVGILKYNNAGYSLAAEAEALNAGLNRDLLLSNSLPQSFVTLLDVPPPPVQKSRYHFNNDLLASLNLMRILRNSWQVKFYGTVLRTRTQLYHQTQSVYSFPSDTITLRENIANTRDETDLRFQATMEKNAAKGYFLNRMFIASGTTRGNGAVFAADSIAERLAQERRLLHNTTTWLLPWRKKFLSLQSFLAINAHEQELEVHRGVFEKLVNNGNPYPALRQKFRTPTVYHRGQVSCSYSAGTIRFSTSIGTHYERQGITAEMERAGSQFMPLLDSFDTDLKWRRLIISAIQSATWQNDRFYISVEGGYAQQLIRWTSTPAVQHNRSRPLITAGLNGTYRLNPYFIFGWTAQVNEFTSNLIDTRTGYFLEHYRLMYRNAVVQPQDTRQASVNINMNYKNVLRSVFGHTFFSIGRNTSGLLSESRFIDNQETRYVYFHENHRTNIVAGMQLSHYFTRVKSTASAGMQLARMRFPVMRSGTLTEYANTMLTMELRTRADITSHSFLGYQLLYDRSGGGQEGAKKFRVKNIRHVMQFDEAIGKWTAGTSLEHLHTDYPQKRAYFFLDLRLVRKLGKRNTDVSVSVTNIFNNSGFVTNHFSDNLFQSADFRLRPRAVMMGLRYQF